MDSIGGIIPFAKEMLNQRPSKCMLKVYILGSSLAVLGVVGNLVETLLQPFLEQEELEDLPAQWIVEEKMKRDKKQVWNPTSVHPEVLDVCERAVKAMHSRGSANRSYAS